MSAQENVAVIRRLYEAFAEGDAETVAAIFARDVVWHEGGVHQLAGDYRGLDGVMAINGHAAEATGGTLSVDVHDILGSDDHAVILQRVTATKDGREHTLDEVLVVHLIDGQVGEVWVAYPDPKAAVELFG